MSHTRSASRYLVTLNPSLNQTRIGQRLSITFLKDLFLMKARRPMF